MPYNSKLEFDEDQKAEIQAGLEVGVDVVSYAKPEFMAIQMRQIRLGLQAGIDVSVYSTTEYDWFQMEEIREGMEQGLDYTLYAKPDVDYSRMRQIRLGLQDGINLSTFIRLEAGVLEELRKSILAKVSIVEFIKEGYIVEQLEQIRYALEMRLDVRPYISKEFRGVAIREIILGLERKLPVSMYATTDYSWQQMREIRLGMERRLDVSQYNDYLFSWQQMREIRLGLEDGLDVSAYRKFIYTAQDMERIRKKLLLEEAENIANGKIKEISDDMISVFISNDEMEACVELTCDDNVTVSSKNITDCLKQYGICQGLLNEEIERIVSEKKYRQTIVVAQGKSPQKGEDGWYEFFFNVNPDRTPKILADGTADYREIKWFETVKEGQKIAYYHSAGFGVAGYTVTGKFIKGKKGKEQSVLSGRGFELLEDGKTYVASMSGKISMPGETQIDITRVYVFEEVNLATGDVMVDGSVYIKGNVGSGTSVIASENLVVDGFVEAANIRCGGDILLKQGVNGANTGRIESGGNVIGQFFESVKVLAGNDISAHYCLNCDLKAGNIIRLHGQNGMLAGGYARAAKGIIAPNVGNKARLATCLNAGIDKETLERAKKIETKIENVNREMTILNHSWEDIRRKYAPEVRNSMELYLKIENAIYTKKLELEKLTEEKAAMNELLREMFGARISVSGTLYEGTEVVIDNVKMKVFTIKDVTVRCSDRKIVVESN